MIAQGTTAAETQITIAETTMVSTINTDITTMRNIIGNGTFLTGHQTMVTIPILGISTYPITTVTTIFTEVTTCSLTAFHGTTLLTYLGF